MRAAYFQCRSGASGDMILGALVDAGASLNTIRRGLSTLKIKGYRLTESAVMRAGLRACKVDVHLSSSAKQPARRLAEIKRIISASKLSPESRSNATAIFKRIFEAEARAHGSTPGSTHLHELAAVDAVVDIVGSVIAIEALGVERVYASAVNVGSGVVKTEHGALPVPAPATLELLSGSPIYSEGPDMELTTPTGAAILAHYAEGRFGAMPLMSLEAAGMGAGGADPKGHPNALRVMIGEMEGGTETSSAEIVQMIETNIDDMSPEIYEHVIGLLLEAGALDAFVTPIIMKKSRPAAKLSVICAEADLAAMASIVLRETTTLGVRHWPAGRLTLPRSVRKVSTRYGVIGVKEARLADGSVKAAPEYEDCRLAALKHKAPLKVVMDEAMVQARRGPLSVRKPRRSR